MKKLFALFLVLLSLSLVSCSNNDSFDDIVQDELY